MSITTTSASCFSATPRATVAPTLPAPPTTVTLRFIAAPCDDGFSRRLEELEDHEQLFLVKTCVRVLRVSSVFVTKRRCCHMFLMLSWPNSDVFSCIAT